MLSRQAGPLVVPPHAVAVHRPLVAVFRDPMGRLLLAPPPRRLPVAVRVRLPPMSPPAPVEVRSVWAHNLQEELALMASLLPCCPIVAFDTEFPGVIHDSDKPRYLLKPAERYTLLKNNVDGLHLIQLGLTLCDATGAARAAWEFNFRDFNVDSDPHAASSIALLKSHGLDFAQLREFGIDSRDFADGFFRSGLGSRRLTWVAFAGSYDFGYLVKILRGGAPLPETLEGFLATVEQIFGMGVLDVKHLGKFCGERGIRGNLEHVASAVSVARSVGKAHNAGSDSLLTSDIFRAMTRRFFRPGGVFSYLGQIDGFV